MPSSPNTPRVLKGGLVLLDPTTSAVQRIIALQYNPDSLSRTLQPQTIGGEGNDRSEPVRFKGPPVETLRIEAEIDAADQLEKGDADATQLGILPQLSALESLVYPSTDQLRSTHSSASGGTLEVAAVQAPVSLFVWSEKRIVPVRVTEFSITEEAFLPNLSPIRAKVTLSMRVLSVADLGFDSKGGSLYLEYQRQKEQAAARTSGAFDALGIRGIP
jgi:hypothetical protein